MSARIVTLVSFELNKDSRGNIDHYWSTAIVRIEGYPENSSFTALCKVKHSSDPLVFEVDSLKRNDGSPVDLLSMKEAGVEFDFSGVFAAHKVAYDLYNATLEARYRQNKIDAWEKSPLHQFEKFSEFMKYAKMTTLEDVLEQQFYSDPLMRLTYTRDSKGNRPFEAFIRAKPRGEFEVSDPVNYGYLKGAFTKPESIVKKLEELYTEYCEKEDRIQTHRTNTACAIERLTYDIGDKVSFNTTYKIICQGSIFSIKCPHPGYAFEDTILQFSEHIEKGTHKYIIEGVSGLFSFESLVKILNIIVSEGNRSF